MTTFQKAVASTTLALLASSVGAAPVSIGTAPGSMTYTNGWLKTGETFTATSDANVLQDWTVKLAGRAGGAGAVDFIVYEWTGSSTGAALYQQTLSWHAAGDYGVSNINLALTVGQTYAAVFDMLGYSGESTGYTGDSFAGGSGIWANARGWSNFSSLDSVFQARFGEVVGANAVPEPGSLALLLAAGAGLAAARRRNRSAA